MPPTKVEIIINTNPPPFPCGFVNLNSIILYLFKLADFTFNLKSLDLARGLRVHALGGLGVKGYTQESLSPKGTYRLEV